MHVHALESHGRRLARRAGAADRPGSVRGLLGPAGTMAGVREGGVLRPAAAVAAGLAFGSAAVTASVRAKCKTHRSR
jgi:hypothetical protein